jgi:hypothetical protein
MVLDGMAHESNGRRVAFVKGFQEELAKRLGLKRRRVQQLIADLRTPEIDPRHPDRPIGKGLHLGLFRVEPTERPRMPDGSTRYGADLYVLLFEKGAPARAVELLAEGQSALNALWPDQARNTVFRPSSALRNENTLSLLEEGESSGVSAVTTVEHGDQEDSDIQEHAKADSDISDGLRRYLEWLRAEHPECFPSWQRTA